MKVGIMQPYLFPYIGYWQLIYAVDRFVILDDVNYIKRGYINRNSILLNGKPYKFTIPIKQASQNRLIMDTKLNFEEKEKKKFLMTISNAYRKAPFYQKVMLLIENIIMNPQDDLTDYIQNSMEVIMRYLDIRTELYRSSQIKKDNTLRAQDRIIEICKKMQADIYINPCGGRELYNHETFKTQEMKLYFLNVCKDKVRYNHGQDNFIADLSIIDVLMFNDKKSLKSILGAYELYE